MRLKFFEVPTAKPIEVAKPMILKEALSDGLGSSQETEFKAR
jgi:hypothetical protein